MKRILSLFVGLSLLFSISARADEGMWLLPLLEKLNMGKMTELGLELSAEEIYSINHNSIKDAIVIFGGGCTAQIISEEGLLITNHHCGYGSIQSHSTVEHDYLKDGFWAMSRDEELPTPGLGVIFLESIKDVSKQVLADVSLDMNEKDRAQAINKAIGGVMKDLDLPETSRGTVQNFFGGNRYYLLVYNTYSDVRLVGAPPSSIGKFGADTDNWMWPRHTNDFSMFRVYMSPDGKPAGYSEDNVPLKPKKFLPVSIKGVEEGDFAMILGYPGSTQRFMTSYGIDYVTTVTHPNRVKIRDIRQKIILEDMLADPKVKIQYASKYSGSTNYYKNSIGQIKQLKELKVKDKKIAREENFKKFLATNPDANAKYGEALDMIKEAYEGKRKWENASQYISETMTRGCEFIGMARSLTRLYSSMEKDADEETIQKTAERIKGGLDRFFKNYNAPTDHKVTAAMLKLYHDDIPADLHPSYFNTIKKKYKNDFGKFADEVFEKSILTDKDRLVEFLDNPSLKVLKKDPGYQLAISVYDLNNTVRSKSVAYDIQLRKGQRLFIAGILEAEKDRSLYPDANFSMRLTYGTVKSYYPRDAVKYKYYTTLKGVMEKEDPNNWEFVVPAKLKELYQAKDYGIYGQGDEMRTCFITDNDITGGNSGSGVINGRGELIGLAFDSNWEGMSGDIAFNPEMQRCVCVDIRYVLFVIDKYAGAKHLVDEMTLVY